VRDREAHLKLSTGKHRVGFCSTPRRVIRRRATAGLFVDLVQTAELRTVNGKRKKRTGFGSHPGRRKGRQWRLRTRRCRTMRGCSSISSNSGAANPQRKTQEADRFWFAPRGTKKAGSGCFGRGAAAPCGALRRSRQTAELRTLNGKRKKRTGFGSHPGRRKRQTVAAPDEALPHHAALFVDLVKQRSCEPSTENAKSGQVLVRTREDKTESINYFPGGMSGALTLCCILNNLSDFRWPSKYLRSRERHANRGWKSCVQSQTLISRRPTSSDSRARSDSHRDKKVTGEEIGEWMSERRRVTQLAGRNPSIRLSPLPTGTGSTLQPFPQIRDGHFNPRPS